jgi:hypothetical protein
MFEWILIVLMIAVMVGVFVFMAPPAEAAGPEITIGEVKTVTCIAPTERTDGTPLLASEIMGYRFVARHEEGHVINLDGLGVDCTTEMDTSSMSEGQWMVAGVTLTTPESGGRESAESVAAPFYLVTLVADPHPPTGVTIL